MTEQRTRRRARRRGSGDVVDEGTATEALEALQVAAPPAPEVRPSDDRNVGFLRKAAHDARDTVREAFRVGQLIRTPYGLVPILVLAISGIIKGFDGSIFTLVVPNIVQDLNLNVVTLLQILNLVNGFILVLATVGIAYMLDRTRRVPWIAGGTILSGIGSLITPQMRSNYGLGLAQTGGGTGATAAAIPELSLAADYYPIDQRGKAFAFTITLNRIGTLFAPYLIAVLVVHTSWRVPFRITGAALVAVGILMLLLLREPIRGYMERRAAGLTEAQAKMPEPPVSFGEAWRTVFAIRTYRRLFLSAIVGGVGDVVYGLTFVFFLVEKYNLGVISRGKLVVVAGAAAIPAGFIGGGLTDSLFRRRPERVLYVSGTLAVLEAASLAYIASKPPLWALTAVFAVFGAAFAAIQPARLAFVSQLVPANMRTLGLNLTAIAAIPAAIVASPLLAQIPTWGFQGELFATVPFFAISALIDISAAPLFPRDARAAVSSQTATAEYREALAKGAVKLLVCRDVDVDYDGVQVLFGVDFHADEGEIVALLGTNGAGKSTLLRAISGTHQASGGAIIFDGRDTTHIPPYEVAGRGIVHMPGGRGIFPGLTVRENLRLATWTHREADPDDPIHRPSPVADIDLDEVLEIFPALAQRLETPAGALSGGEQQMVSLAQAFLQRPRLLLIDELSLGLSPQIVQQLLGCVREINRRGVTIVVVEQSVNVALTIAERAVFMEKGEVRFVGKSADLLRRPDILRAVYVKGTGALTSAPPSAAGRRRPRGDEDRRVVLEVEGLSRSFGGVKAVDDVSFGLRDEEILGLIGPNGAGKTTIFDLISGYLPPDAGRVFYDGVDVTGMGPDERARLQLVRRFQDARLFPSLTVYETLLVALDRRQDVKNTALIALQMPQVRASERRVRRRADQLIELLGLEAYRDKFVKELSTGLRRVTDLACVLAMEPRVLLLDEPSSGIAQAEAESLGPLLLRVRRETGCSILIIEHDMPLISRVADELLALDQGRAVMRGVPETVLNDPRVVESYLGTSEAAIRRSGART
jgi:branched-chain amino acid transport system ATP-binding protein